jgi:hypothetical protein
MRNYLEILKVNIKFWARDINPQHQLASSRTSENISAPKELINLGANGIHSIRGLFAPLHQGGI